MARSFFAKSGKFIIFCFSFLRIYDIIPLYTNEEGNTVQTKVTVTINGQEYNLVAAEDASYMKKVGAHVDGKIQEMLGSGKISTADAAVLAALNIADEYYKSVDAAENLRGQIKGLMEENGDLKSQLSKAKQEIFKLQQKK